jgi:hypothetical protein
MCMMPKAIRSVLIPLALVAFAWLPAAAQAPAQTTPASSGASDRLFQAFAEDSAVVRSQWWEGQFDFASYDSLDVTTANFVVAFQPIRDLEVGGRVGFGSTSGDGLPDGTGATDADVWGKWHFGAGGGPAEFSAGLLATIPTGDDTAGLGFDAFNLEAFGAMRYQMRGFTLAGHLGFRMNGDGQIFGSDPENQIDGKTSAILGGGVIYPLTKAISLVGELNYESERWEGFDSDVRVLGGINWGVTSRGMLRGAVSVGLSDGAPDRRFQVGYAYTF